MKGIKRTLVLFLAAAVAAAGLVCTGVYAASGEYWAEAELVPQFTVEIDGAERIFFNADGERVHPILYSGTTYLPVRAIGELMDKNVNWDQNSLTVTLSGKRTIPAVSGEEDSDAYKMDITVQIRPDFTIIVEGAEQHFTDVSGASVYPMLYNGSTYLPLRAIGNLMNKKVSWDEKTETVSLYGRENDGSPLVTDADTFNETGKGTPSSDLNPDSAQSGQKDAVSGEYIGESKAAEIALAEVPGATEKNIVKLKLDRDDGKMKYEVEIVCDGAEYEIDIDAVSGRILEMDMEKSDR